MKKINLLFAAPLLMLIVSNCGPNFKGTIYKKGNCQISNWDIKASNAVILKNTSSSEIITFTIKETITENNESKTSLFELAPGDELKIGCDNDFQGHKKYEIVGAVAKAK